MDTYHLEELEEAHKSYREGRFLDAARKYSEIAFFLYTNNIHDLDAVKVMRTALDAYSKNAGTKLFKRIIARADKNIPKQFFAAYRYYSDYYEENNEEYIQNIIHEEIPLELGVKQNPVIHFNNEVMHLHHEHEHTRGYKIEPYQLAVATAQGYRDEMEDTYLCVETKLKNDSYAHLFCVMDGHAGRSCADYIKSRIRKKIASFLNPANDVTFFNSLSKIFIELDSNWKRETNYMDYSGAAITTAIIHEGWLWVANVGDCRTVLAQGNKAIQLSEDAKPYMPKYQLEILKRGGFVKWDRVDGGLDMARSIGDIRHPSVSARPTITKFDLSTLDKTQKNLLIMGTDGLWQIIGSQEAVDLCSHLSCVKEMADHLKIQALRGGSADNVTVIVIQL